ncbi:hypothetical protein VQ044_23770, partial [Aurantimonas sp. C2-5-R2]|uniref:hypothetical protein n=1 Tax=Aurantimonas sp. C2-5-R2 TaxID=3113713 RepID=UPI002F9517B7
RLSTISPPSRISGSTLERKPAQNGQSRAERPRREWKIVEKRGGRYVLDCIQNPKVSRFLDAEALSDQQRYEKRQ